MPSTAHGAPYPSTLDAPDGAAQIMALATWADQHGVFYATSSANRDAQYSDLPVGAIVSSGPAGQVWQKTGTGSAWRTLYTDTGWITTGFTPGDGWGPGSYLQGRNLNGLIEVRGEAARTGATITANSDGTLSDTLVYTLPPALTPVGPTQIVGVGRSLGTSGTLNLYANGTLMLVDFTPGGSVSNGSYLRFAMSFLAG